MTEPIGNDQGRFVSTINRAIEMAGAGQLSQTVQLLTELRADFPEAASVRGYLAWFLLQMGRHEEALEESSHAVELAPTSELASLIHFHVLWKAGKRVEGLDEMRRFLMIRPSAKYADIIREWAPDSPTES